MVTIWTSNTTREEWPDADPRVQAYNALHAALGRMCRSNGFDAYAREIHAAQSAVLDGRITPDDAMAMLHDPDVLRRRTNDR